jgi:hypothetical protein
MLAWTFLFWFCSLHMDASRHRLIKIFEYKACACDMANSKAAKRETPLPPRLGGSKKGLQHWAQWGSRHTPLQATQVG